MSKTSRAFGGQPHRRHVLGGDPGAGDDRQIEPGSVVLQVVRDRFVGRRMDHLDAHRLQVLEIGRPDQEVVGNEAHVEPVPGWPG